METVKKYFDYIEKKNELYIKFKFNETNEEFFEENLRSLSIMLINYGNMLFPFTHK